MQKKHTPLRVLVINCSASLTAKCDASKRIKVSLPIRFYLSMSFDEFPRASTCKWECGSTKLTAQLDESDGQMSMRPRKRAREASASFDEASSAIRLSGGHAEKPRTVEAYREGQFVDVEIRSADGLSYRAHGLVAESGRRHSLKGVS